MRAWRPLTVLALASALTTPPALANGEVNVYSERQDFLIRPMLDAFTESTGIKVNSLYAREGIIERIRLEGDNSPADVLLTVDIGRLTDLVEAGLTAPVSNDVIEQNIPANYRDPDGHWFGLTGRARIIVTSRERVAPDAISTYEDLADPRFKGQICTRSGKHVYMVALTAAMIAHHGEDGARDWLEGLKSNLARKPQGNDRGQAKAINEGQCDIAIMNHYYMGAMMANEEQRPWAEAVRVVFPDQDGRGTHMNISGIALVKSAPNRANAIKLMAFLSGDQAQRMYAELNTEYPVKPGVPRSEFVQSLGDFKADTLDLARVAELRATASKLMDIVDYDGG